MSDVLLISVSVLGLIVAVYGLAFAAGWLLAVFKTAADMED